jgi:hypothetical protein
MNRTGGDCLISTAVAIRLYTISYFAWFREWTLFGQLRQLVRFTDQQSVLCMLYTYDRYHNGDHNEVITAVTYNILWMITAGFWTAKWFGMTETCMGDDYPFLHQVIHKTYHYINHGLLLLIFHTHHPFIGGTHMGVNRTALYFLFYLMLIYLPWMFFTGDSIYNI